MSAITTYNHLSLNWNPDSKTDHRFNVFVVIILTVTLTLGFVFSTVNVPPTLRKPHNAVPERIAKFLTAKKKPEIIKPKPKPLPKPKPKPRIKKKAPSKAKKNIPLTKAMKKARKKAETSGLLALNNELADLMDTTKVSAMVSGRKTANNGSKATKINTSLLTKDTGVGSGGIDSNQHVIVRGNTQLSQKELKTFRASLLAKNKPKRATKRTTSSASLRLEEQVTFTFDQNKSKLYSLYNRARRKNPNLKGKLILEITINPSGRVESVRVIESELNDKSLEQRIVARVKQFNFGASGKEKITVTFPIEFVPS